MPDILNFIAENRTLLIVVGVIAVAFLLLRTQQSDVTGGGWPLLVKTGQPVVVEFYSNT